MGDLELFAGDVIRFRIEFAAGLRLGLTHPVAGAPVLAFGYTPASTNGRSTRGASQLLGFEGDPSDVARQTGAINAVRSVALAQYTGVGDPGDSLSIAGVSGEIQMLNAVSLSNAFVGFNAIDFGGEVLPATAPAAVPAPAAALSLTAALWTLLALRRRRRTA
ncbi:MAG: hypothetical protein V2I65_04820 [Paracoccaceae bacterium]|nr:hypothetical protein [Paracoccaceae bacterium]